MQIIKLKKELRKQKINVAVFLKSDTIDDKSIYHLTGIEIGVGLLFVFANKKPVLFRTPLEHLNKNKEVTIKVMDGTSSPYEILEGSLNIALHDGIITKQMHNHIKKNIKKYGKFQKKDKISFTDSTEILTNLRRIKTKQEIDLTIKAIKISEKIFKKLFKELKENPKEYRKESDIATFLKVECIKNNCKHSFEPVVASGTNSKKPHYYPTETSKVQKGFCVIDFGVNYKGYCSDMTRTIYFGTPGKDELQEYDSVLAAIEYAEATIKPKNKTEDIFKDFQEVNFPLIHALGHGIGLDVHEAPVLATRPDVIEIGNLLAIEPAVYYNEDNGNFGIRTEDNFLVEKTGLKKLSSLTRKLQVFKK